MSTGTIKFFSEKGFGYIIINNPPEGTPEEIFYHASSSLDRCEKDDKVSFLISKNQRGPCAIQIKRIRDGNK